VGALKRGPLPGRAPEHEPPEVVVGLRRGHPPYDGDRVGPLAAGDEHRCDDHAIARVAAPVERLARQPGQLTARLRRDGLDELLAVVIGVQPSDGDHGREHGEAGQDQAGEHRADATVPAVSALTVRGLRKRYGGTEALRGVDLEVAEGELVGLLGPNGAGKSTLVKAGCGLVRPTAGSVEVCGAPAGSPPARRALGYLAELFRFPGWASADELLALHQRLARSAGGADERAELLELVGLADARDRRVETMSKGMQQRLGLAQALVGGPRLLLLDEPTSALDPTGRRVVRGLLVELRRRGVAVLLNTHLLSEVERVCDRVAIIDHGLLVAEGRPDELAGARGVEVETAGGVRRFAAASRDDVPGIVARLVGDGEQIFDVRLVRSSLEDAYLAAVEQAP
jgi:ABC-2 type transport system ATP-binding protein